VSNSVRVHEVLGVAVLLLELLAAMYALELGVWLFSRAVSIFHELIAWTFLMCSSI